AAYHVLHRLCMPRHPPIALKTLDRSHYQCPSGSLRTVLAQKDQLLEIRPRVRLGKPIIDRRLSVSRDKPKPSTRRSAERQNLLGTALRLRSSNKSSLHD